ncbi:MAG TPA: LuxR C-terminal-related transcriptional regulator, partial [Ktedonobacteraceae bacterium]|nr:LuxR C-terminal-related transcriptional regulator [Ktedonobacteraceae bacterium]
EMQDCIAWSLSLLGRVAAAQGNYVQARTLCLESLAIIFKVSMKLYLPLLLEGLASVVGAQGEGTWAAQVWGAAEALRESFTKPLPPIERADYDRSVAAARTQLGEKAFAAAWAQGRMMTPEQVAAQGKATISTPTPLTSPLKTTPSSHANPAGLTKREMDVLQLVAQGLTDAQVAEELVITRRTVNWYLTSIYSKIQVSSRSAATRYAVDHHLV